ncbi:MAG: ArsR family transcriptional regulator [Chloroflexi bacterium]|nr:ArsR family transcriptional regulator [Chloroflexota bacterium]
MQETRQYILEILREHGEATVDDIVAYLQRRRGKITPVTVRHHLLRLQQENLITEPQLRHRSTPGRPQHVYALTEKANAHFPNNYQHLALSLLEQLRQHMPPQNINVILEGVADSMAQEARMPNLPLPQKMDVAVEYLSSRGYEAFWERNDEGFILHTSNCPYHEIARENHTLCDMDMRLIAALMGVVPRRVGHVINGDATCAYLIPDKRH